MAKRPAGRRGKPSTTTDWANRLLLLFNVILLALGGWFVATRGISPAPKGWSYQDLITILLTAIAVLLAAVTVFIALAALWGYNTLKESAKSTAETIAREVAEQAARSTATKVARVVTMRELPEMVKVYASFDGQVPGGGTDELTDALKADGDGVEGA